MVYFTGAFYQKIGNVFNLAKPLVRPIYSYLFLNPLLKFLLETIPLEQEYGKTQEKLRFFPSETVSTPEVGDMPAFDAPFKYLEKLTYTTPDIFTTTLEDVLLDLGNGAVLTKSRKIISESLYPQMDLITKAGGFFNKSFLRRKYYGQPVEKIQGYCSIYQGLPNGYYHKFIDLIPRCYLLNHPGYAELDEIKLLYSEPLSEAEKIIIPKIIPNNVKLTCLQPKGLYQIDKLIFPTFLTQFGAGYLPKPYIEKVRSELLPKRPSKKNNRIYVSRAKSASSLKKRHILNEEELFAALDKFGFVRYQLEELSLENKIELFYDAEIVVGAYGGGLTHVIFSENVKILELQIMEKMQTYYYYLSKSLGHDFRWVCSNKSNNRENFAVNISKILSVLNDWNL